MGVNNPNFPSNVLSETEAIQYLGSVVAAQRQQLYTTTAAASTVTAANMVGGVLSVTAAGATNQTTDTAANIIARMKAIDANADVNSTASFRIVNDGAGVATVVGGTGVTIIGTAAVPAGASFAYQIKITGANTVSVTRV